ncbi:AI-2E family transporter [Amorphus sp. 3PC139-8]|uniref:AI-2E family transporter n=1 Tax=Amorphus sp. 3PC139-8 TaxID=2735676 RepID=UPI00345CFAB8
MRIAVTTAAIIWIMITARGVLQPVAVALVVVLVLSAATHKATMLLPRTFRKAEMVARILGAAVVLVVFLTLGLFIAENIAELHANLTLYETNLDRWLALVGELLGEEEHLSVAGLIGRVQITRFALTVAGSTASYLMALLVVLIYVIFIFTEAQALDGKIAALAGDPVRERKIRVYLEKVRRGVYDYLGVQVLIGVLQAVPTFAVLALLGVDAALFWAVLIFVFSFVPTIGTLFGITVPAAMTFLQYSALEPFLIVLVVLGVVQIVCSNVLLPQLTSRSLNLSSLAVLFAVFAGGAVWGIVGALIAVPVLTVVTVICAEVPSLRPVAIILSANGRLPDTGDDEPSPAE